MLPEEYVYYAEHEDPETTTYVIWEPKFKDGYLSSWIEAIPVGYVSSEYIYQFVLQDEFYES